MATNLRLELITPEEVANIYNKCLHILSTNGVKIDHQEALKALAKAGAQVNFDDEIVIFSKDIIENALRTVPHSVKLAGQSEDHDFVIPHSDGMFYTHTNMGAPKYADPNSYHDTTLKDVAEWGQFASVLDEINCVGFVSPQDVPEEAIDIYALKTLFENTSKHIIVQPYFAESVKYLFEIGIAVAGSKESLKKRPVMSILACSLPPFTFDTVHTEVVIQASRLGVPIYANPLANVGASSPVTIPGTVLQSGIEILGKLVMSQLFQPGTPVIARPVPFTLDMSTGRVSESSIEAIICGAAIVQFVKAAFQIPAHTHGFGTDSYTVDGQAMMDGLLRALLVSLAGSDILAGAGQIDNCKVASPIQLIIDNRLTKILKRIKSGMTVDDDTLAWKEMLDMKPGGQYLGLAHTLKHCREALRTGLSLTQSRDAWQAEGSKDLYSLMVEEYKELKKKLQPRKLSEEVKKELDRIVRNAPVNTQSNN